MENETMDEKVCRLASTLARVHDSPHEPDKWEMEVANAIGAKVPATLREEMEKRAIKANEATRLASRVEELENLIAKHSGCSHGIDSASGITSTNGSSEIRKALQVLLRRPQMVDEIGACVFCREILWSKYGVRFPTEHADDCLYTIAKKEIR